MSEISFNTGNIRRAGATMEETIDEFIREYNLLQETVKNTAITGPVKAALEKKLEEKRPIFEMLQKKMSEGADYADNQARKGDQLIEDLQGNLR